MPLIAVAPPQTVPLFGGFDYVTVDAARRRVYAAHGGNRSLLVLDADNGKVLGQVRVGPMAGLAFDPQSGHVYTGNGSGRSVSEVDPVTLKELRSVDVAGAVDAVAYDARAGRIYADEDNGTRIFVIDSRTFKQLAAIRVPGNKPEYLAVNDAARELYQNIDTLSEVAVIDLDTMKVKRTFKTPEIAHNHPLQYDPGTNQIFVGGTNGVLSIYRPDGTLVQKLEVPARIDQCSLDAQRHLLACAGTSKLTVIRSDGATPAQIVAQLDVPRGVHTVGVDEQTGDLWAVWASEQGDFVQRFHLAP